MTARRRGSAPDAGLSLIELLVAMSVLSVMTSLAAVAMVQIYRAVNSVDTVSSAQTQINTAFLRLDREVRYARGISDPAQLSSDWYVEYLLNTKGVDTCVELRLQASTGLLQRREWAKNASPLAPTAWTTLADGVTATTPFAVTDPDTNSLTGARFQRLTVAVTATSGGGRGTSAATGRAGSTRAANVAFTALNATAADSSSTCVEGRGVAS